MAHPRRTMFGSAMLRRLIAPGHSKVKGRTGLILLPSSYQHEEDSLMRSSR